MVQGTVTERSALTWPLPKKPLPPTQLAAKAQGGPD
jgi:hypothetical protein